LGSDYDTYRFTTAGGDYRRRRIDNSVHAPPKEKGRMRLRFIRKRRLQGLPFSEQLQGEEKGLINYILLDALSGGPYDRYQVF
jgi:hypothetical protein